MPDTGTVHEPGEAPPQNGAEREVRALQAEVEELVDGDRLDTTFKRRVALAVSLLALVGGLLGFAATDASTRAALSDRTAKQQAVLALTNENSAAVDTYSALSSYAGASTLKRRADLGRVQAELLGASAAPITAAQWDAVSSRLSDLTPLLRPGRLSARADLLLNDLLKARSVSTLSQDSAQKTAEGWAQKSDQYVGAATVIGVAGALLGLALTVPTGSRGFLVIASAAIVVVTLVFALAVATTPTPETPPEAVQLVAEGDRLAGAKDYVGALAAYDKAIGLDGEYATAYVRRAGVETVQASPENATSSFVITNVSPQAREAAIADLNRALALKPDDYVALVNQGANYFHVLDYGRTEEFSRRAIDLNPGLPLPWMNLGLGLVGQGREPEARSAFDEAIRLIGQRPLARERGELFAAARGTLATAAEQTPSRAALALSLEGLVTKAEGAVVVPRGASAPQAKVSRMSLTSSGSNLRARIDYDTLPTGARLAWIVYYRSPRAGEWVQRTDLSFFEGSTLPPSGSATKDLHDASCPIGGDYRIELFTDDRRLATVTVHQGSEDPPATAGAWPALTPQFEITGRVNICLPPSWAYDTSVTGAIDVAAPDASQRLRIRSIPLVTNPATQEARAQLAGQVLDRLAVSVHGTAVGQDRPAGFLYAPPGVVRGLRFEDGQSGLAWASVGEDGWLRTVTTSSPTQQPDGISNLLGRIAFR